MLVHAAARVQKAAAAANLMRDPTIAQSPIHCRSSWRRPEGYSTREFSKQRERIRANLIKSNLQCAGKFLLRLFARVARGQPCGGALPAHAADGKKPGRGEHEEGQAPRLF